MFLLGYLSYRLRLLPGPYARIILWMNPHYRITDSFHPETNIVVDAKIRKASIYRGSAPREYVREQSEEMLTVIDYCESRFDLDEQRSAEFRNGFAISATVLLKNNQLQSDGDFEFTTEIANGVIEDVASIFDEDGIDEDDDQLGLQSWLNYAERRVPELSAKSSALFDVLAWHLKISSEEGMKAAQYYFMGAVMAHEIVMAHANMHMLKRLYLQDARDMYRREI